MMGTLLLVTADASIKRTTQTVPSTPRVSVSRKHDGPVSAFVCHRTPDESTVNPCKHRPAETPKRSFPVDQQRRCIATERLMFTAVQQ